VQDGGLAAGNRAYLADGFQGAGAVVNVAHPAVSGGSNLSLGTAHTPARAWGCLPAAPLPCPRSQAEDEMGNRPELFRRPRSRLNDGRKETYSMKTVYVIASVSVASLAWGVVAFAEEAPAAEHSRIAWEDLSACKLPNMKRLLPGQGSPLARKEGGTVFSFATRTFSPEPDFDEKTFTVQKFITALKGDIYYAVPDNGCFMVTSGRIADLGKHYLHEFDGKDLPRPDIMVTKEDGHDVPGLLTGIQKRMGHCFLLETTDGKAVLLRIVSQDRKQGEAIVQWVYQPDGSRLFRIPKHVVKAPSTMQAPTVNGAPARVLLAPVNVLDLAKATRSHLENESKLVAACIKMIEAGDDRHLRQIIHVLGEIRSIEAAPVLARNVDRRLSVAGMPISEVTVENTYPVLQALIRIGIPGAQASLNVTAVDAENVQRAKRDPEDERRRLDLRRNLLSLVVLKVYGEKLARIVLEDRTKEAKDPEAKEAFKKALRSFPRIRNWLPDNEARNK